MDLSETIAPKSDQLNADDLITAPVTVTIADVKKGTADQPVNVELQEFPGRPFKPSKSMRRVMVAAWGKYTDTYPGRRLTLYRDPEITFGREKLGGIRISHMSDIDKPVTVPLTVTRGKRQNFTVQPLQDAPPPAPMITRDQWQQIATVAGEKDIPDPLAWASETLGRPLDGPQHITADEAVTLIEKVSES